MKTRLFSRIKRQSPLRAFTAAALLLGAALPAVSYAEADVANYPGLPAGTLQKIGGQIGLETVVENLFTIIANDNRLNYIFLSGDTPELRAARKRDLVATLMGNPPPSAGTGAAQESKLTRTQLNAVIEDTYDAFENCRVSYHVTNRFFGAVADYEKSIVSTYVVPDLHPRATVGTPVPQDAH